MVVVVRHKDSAVVNILLVQDIPVVVVGGTLVAVVEGILVMVEDIP